MTKEEIDFALSALEDIRMNNETQTALCERVIKQNTELTEELAKAHTELKEVKSFLSQLMQCTDAYDFWADECNEIINKYYGGDLSAWDKAND